MGTGGKVGVNTLLNGEKVFNVDPVLGYSGSVWPGLHPPQVSKASNSQGGSHPLQDEVYCYPTNEQEDPDAKVL